MSGDEALLDALAAVRRALLRTGQPHMLIGGLAVIARGVIRDTDDIDATVWAPDLKLPQLVASLARERIVGRIEDLEDFARANQVLLLRHAPSGTPLEISLAWLPFEDEAMGRAENLLLGDTEIPVALAEDLVIYKAVAWRDRDQADIERLLILHRDAIDLDRVREIVRQFADALEEPERVDQFDALVGRVPDGDTP
jgi:hypothetical protein